MQIVSVHRLASHSFQLIKIKLIPNKTSQQIQFILTIIHMARPLIMNDCAYPRSILYMGVSQNFTMLLLFSDFYYKAYIKNNKGRRQKDC